ncbi:MAG: DUF192 domain-containing protein, partial [Candidatus Peribacteraceae bacterium]|nr:DUF192 domain-containing protein [Candidatus Peribacteraceae bacterium]
GFLGLALLAGCGPAMSEARLRRLAAVAVLQQGAVPIQLAGPDGRMVAVLAELARTPAEQQRGLMGRTSLADDAGMLFIFPDSATRSFWMKNTLIPLDIIFFDDAGAFVSQATMVPCSAESGMCPSTLSEGPARFALEVSAGFTQSTGVARDWRLLPGPWGQDS